VVLERYAGRFRSPLNPLARRSVCDGGFWKVRAQLDHPSNGSKCQSPSFPNKTPDSRIRTTSDRSRMGLWRSTAYSNTFEHDSSLIQAPESTRLKMCGGRYGCTHRAASSTRRDRLLFPIELKKRDGVCPFCRCVAFAATPAPPASARPANASRYRRSPKRSVWPVPDRSVR
jgi:hypothetical protein